MKIIEILFYNISKRRQTPAYSSTSIKDTRAAPTKQGTCQSHHFDDILLSERASMIDYLQ